MQAIVMSPGSGTSTVLGVAALSANLLNSAVYIPNMPIPGLKVYRGFS